MFLKIPYALCANQGLRIDATLKVLFWWHWLFKTAIRYYYNYYVRSIKKFCFNLCYSIARLGSSQCRGPLPCFIV